jgi:hypothetical protein
VRRQWIPEDWADYQRLEPFVAKYRNKAGNGPGKQAGQGMPIQLQARQKLQKPVPAHLEGQSQPSSSTSPQSHPVPGRHGRQLNIAGSSNPAHSQIIFLAVSRGEHEHSVVEISTAFMDDDAFYLTLKQNYQQIRGLLRRLFSFTIYSHCNFVRMGCELCLKLNEFLKVELDHDWPRRALFPKS